MPQKVLFSETHFLNMLKKCVSLKSTFWGMVLHCLPRATLEGTAVGVVGLLGST